MIELMLCQIRELPGDERYTTMRLFRTLIVLVLFASGQMESSAAEILLEKDGDNITVTVDGKLFTRYITKSGTKPVLYPIIGPTGVEMTRGYPIKDASASEKTDHPHHRSLWFTHGEVNEVDFWTEPSEDNPKKHGFGKVVHKKFLQIENGEQPRIVTVNEWLNSKDEKLLTDYRTIGFAADEKRRWIDFDVKLVNEGEEPVKIGDTKEGTFGVRVASWMKVDAEKGGKIINSLGAVNKDAWGKAASWVDYHAPNGDSTVGIAILNHPSSFRFPTYWHVRTYGLFAANPFGVHNFLNSEDEDGSHEIKPGESIVLSYRVLLHQGDEQSGRVPESFVEYAKIDKSPVEEEELVAENPVEEEKAPEESLKDPAGEVEETETLQPIEPAAP